MLGLLLLLPSGLLNSYNNIATIYGWAARLMFGSTIFNAQNILINQLPKEGKLLVIGGGNGEILPLIFNHAPLLQIEYLESSSKMIELAKNNMCKGQIVRFNHSNNFKVFNCEFKSVFCAFFFDVFSFSQGQKIVQHLAEQTNNILTWYVADFVINTKTSMRMVRTIQIKLSIIFFNIFAKHEINHLPLVFNLFPKEYFNCLYNNTLSNGFIGVKVFKAK